MSKRKRKLLSTINHTEWELYTQHLSKLIDKLEPCVYVQIYFDKCDNDDDVVDDAVDGDDDDNNSYNDDVDDNYNEHRQDNDNHGNNKLQFIIAEFLVSRVKSNH